ncbi:Tyrosine-protein kinase JAK2 [Merluccius polli]|uniref:Tyrosine-protein kinase n=1 Tax=Merluccius polli TaxID=89951 RepID=A0AA47MPG4_MERPO|nr:Tyrosine-protein kinase JAK2 [Merluccius polli]
MDPVVYAPLLGWGSGENVRSSSSTSPRIKLHLYFLPTNENAVPIDLPFGPITAEIICTKAAKKCGILPVYHSLFALSSSDLSFWYPPTHIFNPEKHTVVHFRVRFFFSNWFGQAPRTSYRYGLTRDRITPVLDYAVIDYLFAQCRRDFVANEGGVSPPLSVQEECLGLAVLDLWRMAKEKNQSVRELCKTISYKSCLPKLHCLDIQRRNRLDRYRIRNMLRLLLKKLGGCSVDEHSLKLKYLMELAAIEPSLGSETFVVNRYVSDQTTETTETTFTSLRVSGEAGIQTGRNQDHDSTLEWKTFCDFQEIIDISMKRVCQDQGLQDTRVVTVTRSNDKHMEAKFQSVTEALSFVSLVDGYFRLTTDSHHFFCQDIAPYSLLENIENHCHGPITSEFAVNKLKKSSSKRGTFVLRQSPMEYQNYFLTVCVQTSLGLDYKDCLISKSDDKYMLLGVQKRFCSLTELTNHYKDNMLLLADEPVKLTCCRPPRAKELTNLIIIRNSRAGQMPHSPNPEPNNFPNIQFQMIKYEQLQWEECLGQGSFTRVFKGTKVETREGEHHRMQVLLKVLDANYKNHWESFFEAASMMSQSSHKHLLLVFGVSVQGAKYIMVQELVKYGALDLYLRRHSSVSVSCKLDIAKQLALALNFLDEKNIVHGNICAKNVLLAREGDPSQGTSPFIKLSDPGIKVSLLATNVILERIPWVGPELLEDPASLSVDCDKWSFGATVWEIFNNGETPLKGWDLDMKHRFYKTYQKLMPSQWTELADLISQCMDYQPAARPSCRAVIRQLNNLITSDYVILHAAAAPPQRDTCWRAVSSKLQEQTVFEERYLRYISQLGKGNFGSVELCRYDPLGDNTGELLAVKKLQPNKHSSLDDFTKEIHTLSVLHCDYIVQYRGVCYSTGRLSMSLVMEYMPYGSLIGYLEKNSSRINIRLMLLFASQICKGMEYLQSMRYVHRDLAARNILVANESLVKIADFGLTKIIPYDKEYYHVTQPGESPIFWHAPESILESKFSHKSDVWSFGVLLHELFSYCNRHHNPKTLYMQRISSNTQSLSIAMHLLTVLKDNWRLPAPADCPSRVYMLIKQCWAYSPEDRPCFSSLTDQMDRLAQEYTLS